MSGVYVVIDLCAWWKDGFAKTLLALTGMLDDFMHFENIRAGKYLRRRPISVRFLEFSAVGPSAEGFFILPMGQYYVVVTFHRPQDFQSNKARHIFH